MKITIIDHQTDGTNFRGNLIKSQIDTLGKNIQTVFIPFIYGKEENDNPPVWEISMFNRIGIAGVYLIHTSNLLAIDLINYLNNHHPDSYIIEYSGGGSEYMNNRQPINQNHCIYPKPINNQGEFPNLISFISALLNQRNNPVDILLGKNKRLELVLEFLHNSLGGKPANTSKLTNGDDAFDLSLKYKSAKVEKTLEEWIKDLQGKKDYEYNIALAIVRDALLEQAGVTGEN